MTVPLVIHHMFFCFHHWHVFFLSRCILRLDHSCNFTAVSVTVLCNQLLSPFHARSVLLLFAFVFCFLLLLLCMCFRSFRRWTSILLTACARRYIIISADAPRNSSRHVVRRGLMWDHYRCQPLAVGSSRTHVTVIHDLENPKQTQVEMLITTNGNCRRLLAR